MIGSALRGLTWPVRTRVGRRVALALASAGAVWFVAGDAILELLWPGRPPGGTVELALEPAPDAAVDPELASELEARYADAGRDALLAALAEREAAFDARVDALLDAQRAAGNARRVRTVDGAPAALDPSIPETAVVRVVHDPEEVRNREPIAWVVWVDPADHPDLARLRGEAAWLRAAVDRTGGDGADADGQ